MADTLREVTIGRGHDPRDFVLLAYGGAGPVHCVGYGAELGVPHILVPATSMAHSAYGALASDIQQSAERSLADARRRRHCAILGRARLRARSIRRLPSSRSSAVSRPWSNRDSRARNAQLARTIDMRYRRQTHDLMVPVPDGPMTAAVARTLVERSRRSYEAIYGKGAGFRDAGIELTTFRVVARRPHAQTLDPQAERDARAEGGTRAAFSSRRRSPGPRPPSSSGWTCRPDSARAARPWSSIRKRRSISGQARARGSTMPATFPSISLSACPGSGNRFPTRPRAKQRARARDEYPSS